MNNLLLRLLLLLLLLLLLFYLPHDDVHAQGPTAQLSTNWTNSPTSNNTIVYPGGTTITVILLRQPVPSYSGPAFAFGFYCRYPCEINHFLSIYIIHINGSLGISNRTRLTPEVVWSANRDRPVKQNSILELTRDGDMLLKDSDGRLAWRTNTTGDKSAVVGLNLSENGNLVLHDTGAAPVWQSFDDPSDCLLSGQSIVDGQRFTAKPSSGNLTRGEFYISKTSDGVFVAFVDSNPPQPYHRFGRKTIKLGSGAFVNVTAKALTFVANSSSSGDTDVTLQKPPVSVTQFLRLRYDGRLGLYEWDPVLQFWSYEGSAIPYERCRFPTVCGRYGICSVGGQCSCPQERSPSTADAFKFVDSRYPTEGCAATSPLSCKSHQQHRLLKLENVSYFIPPNFWNTATEESCKKSCLENCSCKAALFRHDNDASSDLCYLLTEVFSLKEVNGSLNNSAAYIKVQSFSKAPSSSKVRVTIGAVVAALLIILGISIFVYRQKKKAKEAEEDKEVEIFLLGLNRMPTRFSYKDLRSMTNNFAKDRKLGIGGFGSVYEGKLVDGTSMAVKKLESVRQGKREFVAEVQTIGNIHHLNLVRLIGFCLHKFYKLLVYEYMTNGSLDKWIFPRSDGCKLSWSTRRNIICDVARGLLYLHEECWQKIVHLNIKPQNILLDSNFNAKIADFGLAKLIARDQSAVETVMRGTPGYMVPEWLSANVTEKIDVYSFGIVILETVCLRKNLDYSQPEESFHLLPLFKEKAMSGQLLDLLDEKERNVTSDAVEMVEMLKLAIWCLQNDTNKRPSMSMVVKVLEGTLEISEDLNDGFLALAQRIEPQLESTTSIKLLESMLSSTR